MRMYFANNLLSERRSEKRKNSTQWYVLVRAFVWAWVCVGMAHWIRQNHVDSDWIVKWCQWVWNLYVSMYMCMGVDYGYHILHNSNADEIEKQAKKVIQTTRIQKK